MVDIVNYKETSLDTLKKYILTEGKFNPAGIQRASLDLLSDVTYGRINIVDPTSPAILLLEMSSVGTAAAIYENHLLLKRQYPSLALNDEEIFPHRSDKDQVGLFATPSQAKFSIFIQLNKLLSKMVEDPDELCLKATIPRNTLFKVNDLVFSLQYPINIRKFSTGDITVSYDSRVKSPIQTVTPDLIPQYVVKDKAQIEHLWFEIDLLQCFIEYNTPTLEHSRLATYTYTLSQKYLHARVFHLANDGQSYIEIPITYTEQVYDPFTPTAVVKVTEGEVSVFIPPVYVEANLINDSLKIDIYQTNGEISVNLSDFSPDSFIYELYAVDDLLDNSPYIDAMYEIPFYAYSESEVSGGTNGLSSEERRDRVIYHRTYDEVPVTELQLIGAAGLKGFSLEKMIDVVSQRVYLAFRDLPTPNFKSILFPPNLALETLILTSALLTSANGFIDNEKRITIPSSSLFISNNGMLIPIEKSVVASLKASPPEVVIAYLQSKNVRYLPFHYVIDRSQDEYFVRAYQLNRPKEDYISIKTMNYTLGVKVNTDVYALIYEESGYVLTVTTTSDQAYQRLPDNKVSAQLLFTPYGESKQAGVAGTLTQTLSNGERVFKFNLDSKFDIDEFHNLYITNAKMYDGATMPIPTPLKGFFTILYTTTYTPIAFSAIDSDMKLLDFLAPPSSFVISEESLQLTFGTHLNNLWSPRRLASSTPIYRTYTSDLPKVYDRDVFEEDPVTGAFFTITNDPENPLSYQYLHRAGDLILDEEGAPLYHHRAGDLILDELGNPILEDISQRDQWLDLLLVDGSYYFANSQDHIGYLTQLSDIITSYITVDLEAIASKRLENSEVFYAPKKDLGSIEVLIGDDKRVVIDAEQAFNIRYYVKQAVLLDSTLQKSILTTTASILSLEVQKPIVSIGTLREALLSAFQNQVLDIALEGLGGNLNYDTATITNRLHRLSLKKKLVQLEDRTLVVSADIAPTWILYGI